MRGSGVEGLGVQSEGRGMLLGLTAAAAARPPLPLLFLLLQLVSSVASSQVAAAMVGDAERWHDARRSGSGAAPPVKTFEMADIQQWK